MQHITAHLLRGAAIMRNTINTLFFIAAIASARCNNFNLLDKLENPGGGPDSKSHYLFVSSVKTTGNLVNFMTGSCAGNTGPVVADCTCQVLAKTAGLSGSESYVAWLSTATADALCRLQNSNTLACTANSGTTWYNRRNQLVASGLAELVSGNLRAAIQFTENGDVTDATQVFTGTNANGSFTANTCSNWLSGAGSGEVGSPSATGLDWSQMANPNSPLICTSLAPVYCIRKI